MGDGKAGPPFAENDAPAMTLEEAKVFISEVEWRFARTMPHAPHSYIVRMKVSNDKFVAFTKLIREQGTRRKWGPYKHTYLEIDEFSYWTQGAPIASTFILNQARTDSTPQAKPKATKRAVKCVEENETFNRSEK